MSLLGVSFIGGSTEIPVIHFQVMIKTDNINNARMAGIMYACPLGIASTHLKHLGDVQRKTHPQVWCA